MGNDCDDLGEMMKPGNSFKILSLTVCLSALAALSPSAQADYASQYTRAMQGMMANMTGTGAIVASPSQDNPNYYYDWIRDTSLTMKTVVQLSEDTSVPEAIRARLKSQINNWITWELGLQTSRQPATDTNGNPLFGLGEPRYYLTGLVNDQPWGRPQNDGPATRAITAISIANNWIQQGYFDQVKAYLYRADMPAATLIKRDLEYVAAHWQETSYDLWEEERGMHFYTMTMQKVALLKGSQLAQKLGDTEAATYYLNASKGIEQYLTRFIDTQRGIIKYAINKDVPLPWKTSDLDVSVLLAAIQTFDGQFYVPVPQMVTTVNALVQTFQNAYEINKTTMTKANLPLGTSLGRYEQDRYNGYNTKGDPGNPWFLATLAVAEFSCDLIRAKSFPPSAKAQLQETATKQFNRVFFHLPADGSMPEQFNRNNGYSQGARDLTWSYASYVTAYRACFR
jgi:glucoamylase